jgi:hypothetical protein
VISFLIPWVARRLLALTRGKWSDSDSRLDAAADEEGRNDRADDESTETDKTSSAGSDDSVERQDEDRWAALSRQLRAGAGLLGIYICWVVFSYFTFVYGMVRRALRRAAFTR